MLPRMSTLIVYEYSNNPYINNSSTSNVEICERQGFNILCLFIFVWWRARWVGRRQYRIRIDIITRLQTLLQSSRPSRSLVMSTGFQQNANIEVRTSLSLQTMLQTSHLFLRSVLLSVPGGGYVTQSGAIARPWEICNPDPKPNDPNPSLTNYPDVTGTLHAGQVNRQTG